MELISLFRKVNASILRIFYLSSTGTESQFHIALKRETAIILVKYAMRVQHNCTVELAL
jgi:hypothetical protein